MKCKMSKKQCTMHLLKYAMHKLMGMKYLFYSLPHPKSLQMTEFENEKVWRKQMKTMTAMVKTG